MDQNDDDIEEPRTDRSDAAAGAGIGEDQPHDAVSPAAPAPAAPAPAAMYRCKKRSHCVYAIVVVLVIVVAAVVTTHRVIVVSRNDDDEYYPYKDMLNQLNLTQNPTDDEIYQAIQTMNDHYATRCQAGSVLAVTRNGNRLVVPQGVMRVGETEPITPDTLFEIGSISKPLTGLLLAQQVTNGNLDLTTPLNDHLPGTIPDLLVHNKKVTFGQLVTHTAGFPRLSNNVLDWVKNSNHDNPYARSFTEGDMLEQIRITAEEGLGQTGNVEYSNFGFCVLGYLLAKNRNMTFYNLQKSLTDTLNMTSTFSGPLPEDESVRSRLSTGHKHGGAETAPYWYDSGYFIDGAGSTLSSASDLCQLVEALMSSTDLNDGNENDDDSSPLSNALKLSLSPIHEMTSSTEGVAFAWFYGNRTGTSNVTQNENVLWYVHSGGMPGFSTYATFRPAAKTAVVGATNCGGLNDIGAMVNALAIELFGL